MFLNLFFCLYIEKKWIFHNYHTYIRFKISVFRRMTDGKISFKADIHWNSVYKRNYKSKETKHILCFPDHDVRGHRVFKLLLSFLYIAI